MHPKSFVSNFWGAVHMNVAPLFMCLYIVGYCDMVKLIVWSKTCSTLLCRLPEQEALPAWFASVDADIRIGRRRHPHRSAQMY